MVTHDFERGVIRGLSRAAVDVVRRTGRLPADAVHPAMVELWDAVAASRRYDVPEPTMTDLRRLRDGGAGFGLGEREALSGSQKFEHLVGEYRCDCWAGDSPIGEPCELGDEDGTVTQELGDREWTWNASSGKCEMQVTCRSDEPCSCYSTTGSRNLMDESGEYGLTKGRLNSVCNLDGKQRRDCAAEQVKCKANDDGECECKVWCTLDCNSGEWVKITKNGTNKASTWDPCTEDELETGMVTQQRDSCSSTDISSAMFEDMIATGEAAREAFFEEVQRLEELRAGFAEWWDENVEVADVGSASQGVGGASECGDAEPEYSTCDRLFAREYDPATRAGSASEAKQKAERLYRLKLRNEIDAEEGPCSIYSEYQAGTHWNGYPGESLGCCPCCSGGGRPEWYCRAI